MGAFRTFAAVATIIMLAPPTSLGFTADDLVWNYFDPGACIGCGGVAVGDFGSPSAAGMEILMVNSK